MWSVITEEDLRILGQEMASSIVSSAAVASVNKASPAKAAMVAPFTGLKSASSFPVTRQLNTDITSIASNGGRVQCMKVLNSIENIRNYTIYAMHHTEENTFS